MLISINVLTLLCVLAGLLLFFATMRRIRARRIIGATLTGVIALTLFAMLVAALFVSLNLRTYTRLSSEQTVGELLFTQRGDHQFNGTLTLLSGGRANFALRGDEWQIDARIIKWRAFANLVGFDTAYRLERISGRYTRIEDERTQPRTVYPLNPPPQFDLWELVHSYHSWLPWVDALYGSAAYLPMANGALFEIKVSQSGMIARPLNQVARAAVSGWR